jgi:tRNA nucleotidyltransferase (CCA-adding enzyme)
MNFGKCYRVGGFVRDTLLGLEPHDVDYVVVDSSPEIMIANGFEQQGESFPVFLHPETKDEYALARSEISTGDGYNDFHYKWEGVTLPQDLYRRDFTINAMAMLEDGSIFDPHGGRADLDAGVLRHVSPAFSEDPLRILRGARFAARYNLTVAPETHALMVEMTANGMLDALTQERVWQETEKALLGPKPSRFFEVLDECGALAVVFPELHAMKGVPQVPKYHFEGDVWIHNRMVMDEAAELAKNHDKKSRMRIILGAVLHDLGKTVTPKHLLWNPDGSIKGAHHGHESPEVFKKLLDSFAERVRLSTDLYNFAHACAEVHQSVHRIHDMAGGGLARLYDRLGLDRLLRHDQTFLEDLVVMCKADNQGRLQLNADGTSFKPSAYPQGAYFIAAMQAVAQVKPGPIMKEALDRGMDVVTAKSRLIAARRKVGEAFIRSNKAEASPEF